MTDIKQYHPRKWDHIARVMEPLRNKLLKHHGLVVEPNHDNVMESKVLHFAGRVPSEYRVRIDPLRKFIQHQAELYVYKHDQKELYDDWDIERLIEYYLKNQPEYDFMTNNCEDLVCKILLRPSRMTYIKQN